MVGSSISGPTDFIMICTAGRPVVSDETFGQPDGVFDFITVLLQSCLFRVAHHIRFHFQLLRTICCGSGTTEMCRCPEMKSLINVLFAKQMS